MDNLFILPDSYDEKYLDISRCRPLIDNTHELLIKDIIGKKLFYPEATVLDESYIAAGANPSLTRPIFKTFKTEFKRHIAESTLNNITGFDSFIRTDICLGCTQYIDDLHIKGNVQVLVDEYSYHSRINSDVTIVSVDQLVPGKPLIISFPFSKIGTAHPRMKEILDICIEKNINIHIDGAWITAAKNLTLDLSHPAIKSFAVSMSKGYGLSGWNRIGLRWTKEKSEDIITLMNDYEQISTYSVVIGNYFLKHLEPDHLWSKHSKNHYKLCSDFNLTSSDTIHMATKNGSVIGLAPLLKLLEQHV